MVKPLSDLPDDFPPIVIHHCDAGRREPGYMILSLGRGTRATQQTSDFETLVALNTDGDVVWYWSHDHCLTDVKLSPRNVLLVVSTDGCIHEIDAQGNDLRRWRSNWKQGDVRDTDIKVDTYYFHHAVRELPYGNFVALSITSRHFDDYIQNIEEPGADTGPRLLVGDVLVEFTPAGDIVRTHDFFDILDPKRTGYGLDAPFWTICGMVPDGADWTHANGIYHDRRDDSFIVTIRHQDCAIKILRESGEIKWILGTHDGWNEPWKSKLLKPNAGTDWHWHPHDPSVIADGSIMLFDNGESGAFPPSPKRDLNTCISRAVAYLVDEENMTVDQVWSFGEEEHQAPYSMYVSGAYELPTTGNIFVTFGGIILTKDGHDRTFLPPAGHGSAEVFEVTRQEKPEILFHAEINNRDSNEEVGWAIFRSEWVSEAAFKDFIAN